jgi:large subunit ribosomal protein L5
MADDKKDKGAKDKGAKDKAGGGKDAAHAKGGGASQAAARRRAARTQRQGQRQICRGSPRGARGRAEARPQLQARLRTHYRNKVTAALTKKFSYKNPMMVPRLEKVVINMGLGAAVGNPKLIDSAVEDMRAISGQKPIVTRARKSIATYKLREGLPIGVTVTLRAERMWEFVDRLIAFSLPRVRDFKGVSPKGFDGKGNFTMGLREQIIFPEIDYDKIDVVKGMNISFVTTARTDEEGRALLAELGIPFRH